MDPYMWLKDVDLKALCSGRKFTPSPAAWEDQVLYFLLVDRFSDGNEKGCRDGDAQPVYLDNDGKPVTTGTTPPFVPAQAGSAVATPAAAKAWENAGGTWVHGSLKGLTSKLGYLKRLGVTAVWVSPVLKQVDARNTYHGYGVQDFLDVDRHFGTPDDLKALVKEAHRLHIRVILDIILNHTGDVFGYVTNTARYPVYDANGNVVGMDPRWDDGRYPVQGFRDANGSATLPFVAATPDPVPIKAMLVPTRTRTPGPVGVSLNEAVWPAELQRPETFTQKGRISNWDYKPEYCQGDFFDLKDVHHGEGSVEQYYPSDALWSLAKVYQYWIAYADLDGYRIDTVKHMDEGAVRFFVSQIHEFAQSIGKENFYLIGEVTGGRQNAFDTMELTGLDAALGIDDIPDRLTWMVKGYRNPTDYFSLFRNTDQLGKDSHAWFRNRVVTLYDDHDQVCRGGSKARFAALGNGSKFALAALALNVTTLGIPCIYYGDEQCFDGQGGNDRYIREAMFGGDFGAFRTAGVHFFNEGSREYRELAEILKLRARPDKPALRRGRQYLLQVSGNGQDFGIPQMVGNEIRYIVPWSRVMNQDETLLAINTDPDNPHTTWVKVGEGIYPGSGKTAFTCIYSTTPSQKGQQITVQSASGVAAVQLTVPPAGFVIFE